jgi:hypothetical protein
MPKCLTDCGRLRGDEFSPDGENHPRKILEFAKNRPVFV